MRLEQYLNEADKIPDIVRLIKRDCKPWLSTIAPLIGTGKAFCRYVNLKNAVDSLKKLTPRTDREPKDSSRKLHDMFDAYFLKKFGWKARSEGVFVWPVKNVNAFESNLWNVFYPIGDFKFI